MFTPFLTESDPAFSSEGSLDPLGLYAIADSLAVRLVPGVRERQSHPRFLTAIAVSLVICSDFPEDFVSKADGVSEPWQVFEWYMVEGLVRTIKEDALLRGLPGRDKAARAIRDQVPLSAPRYLKTPSVFGGSGAFRRSWLRVAHHLGRGAGTHRLFRRHRRARRRLPANVGGRNSRRPGRWCRSKKRELVGLGVLQSASRSS